jgi:hypothetical protein
MFSKKLGLMMKWWWLNDNKKFECVIKLLYYVIKYTKRKWYITVKMEIL